jgi:hypothetical protein
LAGEQPDMTSVEAILSGIVRGTPS